MLVVGLISATTISNNNITITPATPKSTVCFYQYYIDKTRDDILKYTKQGYMVKNISEQGGYVFVVMEKY